MLKNSGSGRDGLPLAEAARVEVLLGHHPVLHGVDFRIDEGEFVVILGANGSGKTTLIRALLGLAPVAAGEVTLFGVPLGNFKEWARIGYVPQRSSAATGVPATVEEVVLSGRVTRRGALRGYSRGDRARAEEAVAQVGLSSLEKAPVTTLSGGQQQRVLIARALAADPDLLVLDEPVAGVDLPSQDVFAETLGELNRNGATVLLVAHGLGALEPLVSRTVVLRGGHVAYDGRPLDVHIHGEHVHHHPHLEAPPRSPVEPPGRGLV